MPSPDHIPIVPGPLKAVNVLALVAFIVVAYIMGICTGMHMEAVRSKQQRKNGVELGYMRRWITEEDEVRYEWVKPEDFEYDSGRTDQGD